ncbi:DeoR/GlpR family DNA-binding transcription regulator [Sediminibacillus halophilus]|uniref:DeoR family transcriptional regulator, fructose operon transcriptional repressor n=1 Tax=Sediminibacillus halophilus TaxID=482461 RepID=A0A1G9R3L5_9BACI|nr:DeoR/GlpR family DNA-binding transcription regulator [Sediminibacillus halophilus]SDM17447.1 DeoR family transcriptional regulator, fructose operon transcriptional repressor [Sediminibacillus halophilus]
MLTPERHQLIVKQVAEHGTVAIQELIKLTAASESTIRRDLSELENQHKLVRVHGGAASRQTISQELSIPEKTTKNLQEKKRIAAEAAALVEPDEYIYLDAGTTTIEMIPHLKNKNITVVTNGLTHLDALSAQQITTYLTGGLVKHKTRALIGRGAQISLQSYRFDKCFIGVNGIDLAYGLTTPDPEEALIKHQALQSAQQCFVLADHTKFGQVSFSKIADLEEVLLITNKMDEAIISPYHDKTNIKVV